MMVSVLLSKLSVIMLSPSRLLNSETSYTI
jgi:hypothetical protein